MESDTPHSPSLSVSDGILLVVFAYCAYDLVSRWDAFHTCCYPVQIWLLASLGCICCFRGLEYVGYHINNENNYRDGIPAAPPYVDHTSSAGANAKRLSSRTVQQLASFVLFPFFVAITLMGTFFTVEIKRHTPQCLPRDFEMWFLDLWMLLSYAWMVLQSILCVLLVMSELRLRNARAAAGMLITSDTERVWGASGSNLVGELMNEIYPADSYVGLAPTAIAKLPVKIYGGSSSSTPTHYCPTASASSSYSSSCCSPGSFCCDEATLPLTSSRTQCFSHPQCSICIENVLQGDEVRELRCGHTFHRACLDLWLLRSSLCPNCKQDLAFDDASYNRNDDCRKKV